MIYGYARVSTKGQAKDGNSLEYQRQLLTDKGATVIFEEAYTGTKADRPELNKLMELLKPNDTVIVTKLDRLARNVSEGLNIIDRIIHEKGCSIVIENMGTFDNSITGKLIRTVLLAVAEFERDCIVQRTQEGKAIAREREGYKDGRPKVEVPDFQKYFEKQKEGLLSVDECCEQLGISRRTWYNRVKELKVS